MEDVGLKMTSQQRACVEPSFWRNKRVLLTGHTGFKGSWLALWLQSMGVDLQGYSLSPPTNPNLFERAQVTTNMRSEIGDIRDYEVLHKAVMNFRPEIVIHMAAQPLVRHSYKNPIETYATNVMGVVHLLEAVRKAGTVKAVVNVTTDKCYENNEWVWGYRENEPMGGSDPYSSSKGCSELVTSAYRQSFFLAEGIGLASARAGNVIGGGDWAEDRLVPDILRAFENNQPVIIRNPKSIRPWQHVLEPLSGYLILAQKLWSDPLTYAGGWNFGPRDDDVQSVEWIVENLATLLGNEAKWEIDAGFNPHEASYLKLDISKALSLLAWKPKWSLGVALEKIVQWDSHVRGSHNAGEVCLEQIKSYVQA